MPREVVEIQDVSTNIVETENNIIEVFEIGIVGQQGKSAVVDISGGVLSINEVPNDLAGNVEITLPGYTKDEGASVPGSLVFNSSIPGDIQVLSGAIDENTADIAEISATITGGGSGFTPIEGEGITITPTGDDFIFSVEDYISKTEVAGISGDLQNQININTSNIADNSTDIQVLSGAIDINTTAIAVNASNIFDNEVDIQALSGAIDDNTSNISDNSTDIQVLSGAIDENTADIAEISAAITGGAESFEIIGDNGISAENNNGTWTVGISSVDKLDYNLDAPQFAHQEGRTYWNNDDHTLNVDTDIDDVTLQVGQELHIRGKNNTGVTLTNGTLVNISNADNGQLTFDIASNHSENIDDHLVLAMVTKDILPGEIGIGTKLGLVRDVDTSMVSAGVPLYLGNNGDFVDVRPAFPQRDIIIGYASESSISGAVFMNIIQDKNPNDFNGTAIQRQDTFVVPVTGEDKVYFETELIGGGNLPLLFRGAEYWLDCTTGDGIGGRARAEMTLGSANTSLFQIAYVELVNNVPVLKVDAPEIVYGTKTEYAFIAFVSIRDFNSVLTDGPDVHQRTTDAISHSSNPGLDANGRGRVSYQDERIRALGASYWTGVQPTLTITPNPAALDNVNFETTAGTAYQLHLQNFPGRNIAVDGIYVGNGNGGNLLSYQKVNGLEDILEDTQGNSLTQSRYNLVVYATINKNQTECKLFVNLPTGSYGNNSQCYNDRDNTAVSSVLPELRTIAFLVGRIPLRHRNTGNGTITAVGDEIGGLPQVIDLRGTPIGGNAQGGTAASTSFSDAQFEIFNETDPTKEAEFDASQISTGTNRTFTFPDKDGVLAIEGDALPITGGTVTGDLTVNGDVFINGDEFVVNTTSVSATDNIIEINAGEVGPGVTAGYAGIKVDRGSASDYFFIFDEIRDGFAVGVSTDETSGNLQFTQLVATREDNPDENGIAHWRDSSKFFETNPNFTYDGSELRVNADTDTNHTLGRARIGGGGIVDTATFAHIDNFTNTNYSIRQSAAGDTNLNSVTETFFRIGGTEIATFDTDGLTVASGKNIDAPSLRANGLVTSGWTGPGLEFLYDGAGFLQSYDRTLASWQTLALRGSTIRMEPNASLTAEFDSSGLKFTNNTSRLFWKDSGGTDRRVLYMGGDNDLYFGVVDGVATGGDINVYADGSQVATFTSSGLSMASGKKLSFAPDTNLTISSGQVTINQNVHRIDTQGGASTDDLDTINGGVDGDILVFRPVSSNRTIVAKRGTGNLALQSDFSMETSGHIIILIKTAGFWQELSRSIN